MRTAIVLSLVGIALGFPAAAPDAHGSAAGCPFAAKAQRHKRQAKPDTVFDPVKQKIDVTGEHAFMPPKEGDQRGPCPGLNAMANHGYLPRNGITTMIGAVEACQKVYGLGDDMGRGLSGIATVLDGDPVAQTWSIGGATPASIPLLLSPPQGLNGAHNKFEGDASVTRADFFVGDPISLNMSFFKQLYNRQEEGSPTANFDLATIVDHHADRVKYSIATNPYFFRGPFGIVAAAGAYGFIPGLMSNHSADKPQGFLNHEVLRSFYGVTGTGDNLSYKKGYERIPDNWYKRNNDYDFDAFRDDWLFAAARHPETVLFGGNTGTVNSYAGIDLGNLTGGVYNLKNLAQGNNALCFAFQSSQQITPDVLRGTLVANTAKALEAISSIFSPILKALSCPTLTHLEPSAYKPYPGANGGPR